MNIDERLEKLTERRDKAILFAVHCGKRPLVHGQAIVAKGGD
jgi:hypothetical protein